MLLFPILTVFPCLKKDIVYFVRSTVFYDWKNISIQHNAAVIIIHGHSVNLRLPDFVEIVCGNLIDYPAGKQRQRVTLNIRDSIFTNHSNSFLDMAVLN